MSRIVPFRAGPRRPCPTARPRRGTVIVLLAVMLVAVLAFVAFGVDVGYMYSVKTELQRAADAAALAGANGLVQGTAEAEDAARDIVDLNKVGAHTLSDSDVGVEVGVWNKNTLTFTAGGESPNAVRVTLTNNDQPLFFGKVLNKHDFDLQTSAVATYQPRDIQVVLDFSASMSDDSELQSASALGTSVVEGYLAQIYADLGSPTYGSMTWCTSAQWSSKSTSWVKTQLGLNSVPYPYPSGSWTGYIDYVKKNSSNNLPNAYKHRYGYMTWLNYVQEKYPGANQTPGFHVASSQPVDALREATGVFMAYLQEVDTEDRAGLTIYTADDGTAELEQTLTYDLPVIDTIVSQRQAGHYDQFTNIGDGIAVGRDDLVNNGRVGAKKLLVLMTDGLANRPDDVDDPIEYTLEQAQLCADAGIPIVCISLGAEADTDTMDEVAAITGGVHFNIGGGHTASEYQEELEEIFRQVADDRALLLVK
jgi:Flp pilus assembly protein TadG